MDARAQEYEEIAVRSTALDLSQRAQQNQHQRQQPPSRCRRVPRMHRQEGRVRGRLASSSSDSRRKRRWAVADNASAVVWVVAQTPILPEPCRAAVSAARLAQAPAIPAGAARGRAADGSAR
eukprot:7381842-Prymnesium_polylepis.1